MNHSILDWKMESDTGYFHVPLCASNEKKYDEQEDNLIELLWKDGQLILQNQTSCSSPTTTDESNQPQKTEDVSKSGGFLGNFMSMNRVDETASWFQNPLDNSLENEFEEFLSGVKNSDSNNKVQRCVKDTDGSQNSMMLYDSSNQSTILQKGVYLNSPHQMKSGREEMSSFAPVASGSDSVMRTGELSLMLSNESTICGSSQYPKTSNNDRATDNFLLGSPQNWRRETTFDPMISPSSGGSGCSFGGAGQQTTANHGHKRKERVMQESEHHMENVEQKSLEERKQAQKTAPSRRSRPAGVHNLSERRRRDRINEKMKALQDLIPHHNKSDKASMLEEAIGYLKSLQLQLQILYMGGGMAPMVFPGAQQYIPSMGIGMGHPTLPSFRNPVQLPVATLHNQFMPPFSAPNLPMVCPSLGISPLRHPNQIPNVRLSESFPHYFGFPRTQMPTQVCELDSSLSPCCKSSKFMQRLCTCTPMDHK